MLRLSGTVYVKTIAILYLRRHLTISSTNHSRLSLLAPLHSRFSGSLDLALFSFHITIIISVSLISSHFICYTAYYCSIVSENKPPSSFTPAWLAFAGTLNRLTHLRYYYLISSYVNIFVTLISFIWRNRQRYPRIVGRYTACTQYDVQHSMDRQVYNFAHSVQVYSSRQLFHKTHTEVTFHQRIMSVHRRTSFEWRVYCNVMAYIYHSRDYCIESWCTESYTRWTTDIEYLRWRGGFEFVNDRGERERDRESVSVRDGDCGLGESYRCMDRQICTHEI